MPQNKIQEPSYERFIARHFPSWHAKRQEARLTANAYASYRGAMNTRLGTPWGMESSRISGSIADRMQQFSMRDRARRVYRENPIGRSLLDTETDNVVSDGFTLQAKTDSEKFNDEVEYRWYTWLDRYADIRGLTNASGLMRTTWRNPRMDGDGGIVLVDVQGQSRLQYVPGDWIRNPDSTFGGRTDRGTYLADGIETDRTGRPLRYWFQTEDDSGRRKAESVEPDNFVYLPHLNDPPAVRGATVYAPIFTLLDQLDGYVDAVTVAARMAAIFGLIFKKKNAAKEYSGIPILAQNGNGEASRTVTLESGMIKYIGTDEEVAQVNPTQPMNGMPEFIRALFRLICLPFDMPLEIGMKDLSQVNFSGGRIGLIAYYRSCRAKQDWLMSRCWSRIYRWWIDREVKLQRFTNPVPDGIGQDGRAAFENHLFFGREWEYTDPVSEAQADLLEISMGIKSPQQASALRGRDFVTTQSEIAEARGSNTKSGVPNILSGLTRDEPSADDGTNKFTALANAYGISVRAGVLTPNLEDEKHFRVQAGLPKVNEAVEKAWEEQEVRQPITIQQDAAEQTSNTDEQTKQAE